MIQKYWLPLISVQYALTGQTDLIRLSSSEGKTVLTFPWVGSLFLTGLLKQELHFSVAHSSLYLKYAFSSLFPLRSPMTVAYKHTHSNAHGRAAAQLRPGVRSQGSEVIIPCPDLSVWTDNEKGQSFACFAAWVVGRWTPLTISECKSVWVHVCMSRVAEPCSWRAIDSFLVREKSMLSQKGTMQDQLLIVGCLLESWVVRWSCYSHQHEPDTTKLLWIYMVSWFSNCLEFYVTNIN